MADIKIRLSETGRAGEVIEVKTLALAPPLPNPDAEFDADGIPIPHYVGLTAEFDGRPLLRTVFAPGTARNVMFTFSFKADRSGILVLRWQMRDGGVEERRLACKQHVTE